MGLLGSRGGGGAMSSPIQQHRVHIANDVLWFTGELETLGNPHNYINQDDLEFLRIKQPHVAPWSFTGLPASHLPLIVAVRDRTQFIIFPDDAAMKQFRPPMRTSTLVFNLSLAVIRGDTVFLSEALVHNFLDFWKGVFFPVVDASIYYLADGPAEHPTEVPLLYLNRNVIQSYAEG